MADNQPQDIFESVQPDASVSADANQNNEESSTEDILLYSQVQSLLDIAENYISETRTDLEQPGVTEQWIESLTTEIATAKQSLQILQADTTKDPVAWTDENGTVHDVIMRSHNKRVFDRFKKQYIAIQTQFDQYFKKHVALLKARSNKS